MATAGRRGRGGCWKGLAAADGGEDDCDEDQRELLSQSGTFFTILVGD